MKCPLCGAWNEVIRTRQVRDGSAIRRRRECANGHRFNTFETAVVTKAGRPAGPQPGR